VYGRLVQPEEVSALIAPRIRQLTRPAILVAGVVALALAPASYANRAKVGPLAPVSGASPFQGDCGVSGKPYRDAEVEPHLAVDPRKPRHLVAAWQQDRFPTGGALSNVTASSRNGGRSWRQTLVPGVSQCTGGDYEWASDPWLAVGPEGNAYLASLPGTPGIPAPAMIVNRSTNGGRSWSEPVFADRRSDVVAFNDKETLTTDPFRPGAAYMVWIRNTLVSTASGPSFTNDLYFTRTVDGGRTWSTPAPIQEGTLSERPATSEMIVTGRGRLVCVFSTRELANGEPKQGGRIDFVAIRSRDGGSTWSSPVHIGETRAIPLTDPESDTDIRTGATIFSAEGGPGRGGRRAYVAWQDPLSARSSRIFLSSSKDGQRWSKPRLVSAGATTPFTPDLAIAGNGILGVRFYDLRNDVPDDATLTTDSWFRHSHDRGRTWQEARLGESFDLRTAPEITGGVVSRGYMLGEYEGLVGMRRSFATAFARAQPAALAGPTDIFFARIGLKRRGR
jgi:hypothetical protein